MVRMAGSLRVFHVLHVIHAFRALLASHVFLSGTRANSNSKSRLSGILRRNLASASNAGNTRITSITSPSDVTGESPFKQGRGVADSYGKAAGGLSCPHG